MIFPADLALLLINLTGATTHDTKGAIVLISIILWFAILACFSGAICFIISKTLNIKF